MKWSSISEVMNPRIEPESVICSDGDLAYRRVAQQTGCEHMIGKTGGRNTRGISIHRIDAYAFRPSAKPAAAPASSMRAP